MKIKDMRIQGTSEETGKGLKDFYDAHFKENNEEIQGMNITTKIMFDRNFSREERNKLMCQIENEFSEVLSKHKDLVGIGGQGEWIYKNNANKELDK